MIRGNAGTFIQAPGRSLKQRLYAIRLRCQVQVIQKGKGTLLRAELRLQGDKRLMHGKCKQCRHERVALLPAFCLQHTVGLAYTVMPHIRPIPHADVREQPACTRHVTECLEHGLPTHVVVGSYAIHGQDRCGRSSLREDLQSVD